MAAPVGTAKFRCNFNPERTKRAIQREVRATVHNGQREFLDLVRQKFVQPKHGYTYFRLNPPRWHRASAPGESPARDTGKLANNVISRSLNGGMVYRVSFKMPYAHELENGTRPRVKKRPFAQVTLDEMAPHFVRDMSNRISYAIRTL